MSTNEIASKIVELKEYERMVEEAQGYIDAIKDEIKAHMTERNVEELVVDIFKVRWTTVSSPRIDTTALKKAMPDLAKQFTVTTTSRRFSIV